MWKTYLILNLEMTNKKRVDFFPQNFLPNPFSVTTRILAILQKIELAISFARLIFSLLLLHLHVISIK